MTGQQHQSRGICRHCGDHTEEGDDRACDLGSMCQKAGRTSNQEQAHCQQHGAVLTCDPSWGYSCPQGCHLGWSELSAAQQAGIIRALNPGNGDNDCPTARDDHD